MSLRRAPPVPIPSVSSSYASSSLFRFSIAQLRRELPKAATAPTAALPPNNPGPNQPSPMNLNNLGDDALAEILAQPTLSCVTVIKYLQSIGKSFLAETQGLWQAICVRKGWTSNPFDDGGMVPYESTWRMHFNEWCQVITLLEEGALDMGDTSIFPIQYTSDYAFMLAAVKAEGKNLVYASNELQNNYDIVLAAVQQDGNLVNYASEELQNDTRIIAVALEHYDGDFYDAPVAFKNNYDFVMEEVKKHGMSLRQASVRLQSDRSIVMAAVQDAGLALLYASDNLKSNADIVMSAVLEDGNALQYASVTLKNTFLIVMAAVQQDGNALAYASARLQADDRIFKVALARYDRTFAYAPAVFRDNYDFVLKAVQDDGNNMRFASVRLKMDRNLVLTAVNSTRVNWTVTLDDVDESDYFDRIQRNTPGSVDVAMTYFADDDEIVRMAINKYSAAFARASQRLQRDPDFARLVLSPRRYIYSKKMSLRANPIFNDVYGIVFELVKARSEDEDEGDTNSLFYASERLQGDKSIVTKAVQANGGALEYASEELKKDRDVVLAAVQTDGYALQYAPEELKKDRDVVLAAVQTHGYALEYASPELKDDDEIVLAAVTEDIDALPSASERLQADPDIRAAARKIV